MDTPTLCTVRLIPNILRGKGNFKLYFNSFLCVAIPKYSTSKLKLWKGYVFFLTFVYSCISDLEPS